MLSCPQHAWFGQSAGHLRLGTGLQFSLVLTDWALKPSFGSVTKPAGCHCSRSTKPTRRPRQSFCKSSAAPGSVLGANRCLQRFTISRALFVKPPNASRSGLPGCVPDASISPGVAFKEKTAFRLAGCTRDPSVSDPNDMGAKPAATPTALPEEEPDGVYCVQFSALDLCSLGLTLCPRKVAFDNTPPRTYGDKVLQH